MSRLKALLFRVAPLVLLFTLPLLGTALLVAVTFQRFFWNILLTGTDEVDYWLEIRAVHYFGLHFGNFNLNEHVAAAGLRHFGPHGPVFPLLYGLLSLVVGWRYYSPLLLNTIILGLAFSLFSSLAKFPKREHFLYFLLVLTAYSAWLFIPSVSEEPVQISLAVLFAGLIIRYREHNDAWVVAWLVLTAALGTTLRPTWAIFVAAAMVFMPWRQGMLLTLVSALAIFFDLKFWGLFSPGFITTRTGHSISSLLDRVGVQVSFLLLPHDATILEIGLRYQTLIMLAVAIVMLIRRRTLKPSTKQTIAYDWFHLVNLGGVLLALLFLYDIFDWRDYRILAPHVVCSLCLMLKDARYSKLISVLLLLNVLLLPFFYKSYKYWHASHYARSGTSINEFGHEISGLLQYNPQRDSWDNTLLYAVNEYADLGDFVALPPGFGLSMSFTPEGLSLPPHSRYILADSVRADSLVRSARLVPLRKTSHGWLYENHSQPVDRR